MGVVVKTIEKFFNALVDKSVMSDVPGPILQLFFGGQFAVQEKVSSLEIGAFFRELLNGITAVTQNSFVAIDVSYAADAGSGVVVGRVVTHHAEIARIGLDLAQVHGPDSAVLDRHVVSLAGAIVGDG